MGSSKEQIAAFQRRLVAVQKLKEQAEKSKKKAEKAKKEAEVARGEDEQHGYNVRVAETEESLRAKVPAVYQAYCAQTWSEALNRAEVEATSDLRKPEISSTHQPYRPRPLLPVTTMWPLPLLIPPKRHSLRILLLPASKS